MKPLNLGKFMDNLHAISGGFRLKREAGLVGESIVSDRRDGREIQLLAVRMKRISEESFFCEYDHFLWLQNGPDYLAKTEF